MIADRIKTLRLTDYLAGYPTAFWDVFGEQGLPVRTTISEMGPLLLSRILDLNETQSGVLNLVFKLQMITGCCCSTFDLRAMVQFAGDQAETVQNRIWKYLCCQHWCHSAKPSCH